MHAEPPWWEWLLAPSAELKRLGVDPKHRLAKTGHRRPFPASWARSVGLWGVGKAEDILGAVGHGAQSLKDKQLIRYSYDMFKHRNHLWSSRQLMTYYALDGTTVYALGRIRLATEVHARIHFMRDENPALSLGAAAGLAVSPSISKYEPLGILPIEAVRYYLAIEHILEDTGMPVRKWIADVDSVHAWEWRRLQWDRLECDLFVRLPNEALQKYDPTV